MGFLPFFFDCTCSAYNWLTRDTRAYWSIYTHRVTILVVQRSVTMGRLTLILIILSLIGSTLVMVGGDQFVKSEFPAVSILKTEYPSLKYRGPKESFEVKLYSFPPKGWVPLSRISVKAIQAIVISEDSAFYQHRGYDPQQINEALRKDFQERRFARGASTITQQVVRNVFLEKEKKIWRKVKELYLAVQLEKSVSKRRILEVYLNIAEWGEGIYGISAASRYYFGKQPEFLTAKEGAFLAMLLPSPKRYSQSYRRRDLTRYAENSIQSILNKMAMTHKLTPEEFEQEKLEPLSFRVDELAP